MAALAQVAQSLPLLGVAVGAEEVRVVPPAAVPAVALGKPAAGMKPSPEGSQPSGLRDEAAAGVSVGDLVVAAEAEVHRVVEVYPG